MQPRPRRISLLRALHANYVFGQNMTEHNPAPSPSGHPLLSGPPTFTDIHQIFTCMRIYSAAGGSAAGYSAMRARSSEVSPPPGATVGAAGIGVRAAGASAAGASAAGAAAASAALVAAAAASAAA